MSTSRRASSAASAARASRRSSPAQPGNWLIACSPLPLALIVLFFITFHQDSKAAAVGAAGLTERILAIEVQAPFIALAWLAFKMPAASSR